MKTSVLAFCVLLLAGCGSEHSIIPTVHAQAPSGGNQILSGHYIYTSTLWVPQHWPDVNQGTTSTNWVPVQEAGEIFADGNGHFTLHGTMDTAGETVMAESEWTYSLTGTRGNGSSTANDKANIYCSTDGSRCVFINVTFPGNGAEWTAIFIRDAH